MFGRFNLANIAPYLHIIWKLLTKRQQTTKQTKMRDVWSKVNSFMIQHRIIGCITPIKNTSCVVCEEINDRDTG